MKHPINRLFEQCRNQGVECIVLLAKGDEINSAQMSMSTVSSSMEQSIALLKYYSLEKSGAQPVEGQI